MSYPDCIKNLQIGESYTFSFKDPEGNFEETPWGLIIPDLTVNCVKYSSGKAFYWHYDVAFTDLIFESCKMGVSNPRFDKFIFEKTCVSCHSFRVTQQEQNKERYEQLTKDRLSFHKNALLSTSDFDKLNPNVCEKTDIDLSKEWFKGRLAVISRLDPEWKKSEEVEHKFAQINIAPKKKKDV